MFSEDAFNSLFEMHLSRSMPSTASMFKTFNSLFEMPERNSRGDQGEGEEAFQFSI